MVVKRMYKMYDNVKLKDGRVGCIVDISGDVGYIVDIGNSPKDWETIAITKEEVDGLADTAMTEATIKFIISRVVEKANDALKESISNKDDLYYEGRKIAYYEVLDTIKSELDVHDQDLKKYGLDIDLEKTFL